MKKIIRFVFCLFLVFTLAGCGNLSKPEPDEFKLTPNIECEINGYQIDMIVENDVDSYSFINAFSIPDNYRWELHWDKSCLSSLAIVSKNVHLDEGDNILYCLFVNKNNPDEIYLYELIVHRIYNALLSYYLYNPNTETISAKPIYTERITTKKDYVLNYIPNANDLTPGYSFLRYADRELNEISKVNVSSNYDIIIIQDANTYLITLNVNGGNALSKTKFSVKYGAVYELPQPTRDDYSFLGWYDNSNNKFDLTGTFKSLNNVELTAKWDYSYIDYNLSTNDSLLSNAITYESLPMDAVYDSSKNIYTYTMSTTITFDETKIENLDEIKSWNLDIYVYFSFEVVCHKTDGTYDRKTVSTSKYYGQISDQIFNKNTLTIGVSFTSEDLKSMISGAYSWYQVNDGYYTNGKKSVSYNTWVTYSGNIVYKQKN